MKKLPIKTVASKSLVGVMLNIRKGMGLGNMPWHMATNEE